MITDVTGTADAAFWRVADRHLVRFGGSFTPQIISRAEGGSASTRVTHYSSRSAATCINRWAGRELQNPDKLGIRRRRN